MTLAENLKRIRTAKGLSQQALAKLARVSQQLISRLESGQDQTTKKLPMLANALLVTVTELDPNYETGADAASITLVPRLSWVSAGDWWLPEQVVEGDDLPTMAVSDLPEGDWVALTVDGSSMDRISPPGSVIIPHFPSKALISLS